MVKYANKDSLFLIALHPSNDFPFIGESQGICAISGYIQAVYKTHVSVHLYDQQIDSLENMVAEMVTYKPAIVGVSVKMFTFDEFEKLYSLLVERIFPIYRPLVVVGNSVAHFSGKEILAKYDVIIALGEGEVAFPYLYEFALGRIKLEEVPNIMYLRDGKCTCSHYEYFDIRKMTEADRRYSKIYYDRGGEVYIEGSRGCAYCGCNICECRDFLGSHGQQFRWRDRPLNSLIAELRKLESMGINKVTFSDEDFLGRDKYGLERALKFAGMVIEEGVQVSFRINARVRSIYNGRDTAEMKTFRYKVLSALKDAGLIKIFLGLESGSQTQLDRYGKGFHLNDFLQAKKLLDGIAIEYELGYICLDPLMSMEELDESLVFIREHRCIGCISSIYKELRLQKGNKSYMHKIREYEMTHYVSLIGPLNMNEQIYPVIKYADERIDVIKHLMDNYESETYKLYYYLRIVTQYAENDNEDSFTNMFHESMRKIKMNDYELLVGLITGIKMGYGKNELNNIVEKYKKKRKGIYTRLIKNIEQINVPKCSNLISNYRKTYE